MPGSEGADGLWRATRDAAKVYTCENKFGSDTIKGRESAQEQGCFGELQCCISYALQCYTEAVLFLLRRSKGSNCFVSKGII